MACSVFTHNAQPLFILRMSCLPLAILGQTLKIFFIHLLLMFFADIWKYSYI